MDNRALLERMKGEFRNILNRALIDAGNSFEALKDNAESALETVLDEIMEQIYK